MRRSHCLHGQYYQACRLNASSDLKQRRAQVRSIGERAGITRVEALLG